MVLLIINIVKKLNLKLLIILIISSFSYKSIPLENIHKEHLLIVNNLKKISVQVSHKHFENKNNQTRTIIINSFLFKDSNNLFCILNNESYNYNSYICVSNDTTFEIHREIKTTLDSTITNSRYFPISYKHLDFYKEYKMFFENDFFENSKKTEKFCKTIIKTEKSKNNKSYKMYKKFYMNDTILFFTENTEFYFKDNILQKYIRKTYSKEFDIYIDDEYIYSYSTFNNDIKGLCLDLKKEIIKTNPQNGTLCNR